MGGLPRGVPSPNTGNRTFYQRLTSQSDPPEQTTGAHGSEFGQDVNETDSPDYAAYFLASENHRAEVLKPGDFNNL